MTKINTSVIILAAGRSSRLGMPKLLLEFNDGTPFIHHIINQYLDFGCNEIVVVINSSCSEIADHLNLKSSTNVKVAINEDPDAGRFGSIRTGAENMQNTTPVFIHNTDNPFAHHTTLTGLHAGLKDSVYAYPVYKGKGGHPVLIGSGVVRSILQSKKSDHVLSAFLKKFNGKAIEVDDRDILWNINTPDALKRFRMENASDSG